MLPPLISLVWTGGIAWLLWRAVRQFQSYEALKPAAPRDTEETPTLAVIVPARNEASRIDRCLAGLLAQDYPAERLTIVVVDDNSTDGTSDAASRVAGEDPRVRVLRACPLPAGWAGKPHACWQGAAAIPASEWLCFVDADTAASPPLLTSAVRFADDRQVDMLSLEPFQELGSFWERIIFPTGMFLLAFTQDLRRVNDPARSEAVANGQFILIRRTAYEAVGGFAAVRQEICEDKALARLVKWSGYRLALIGAEGLLRVRMYHGLRSLWDGVVKNVVEMAGGRMGALGAAGFALLLGWAPLVLPLWATRRAVAAGDTGSVTAVVVTLAGSLALLGTHVAGARHFRIPFWYGFLFPLGYTSVAVLAMDGLRRHLRGDISWKGRLYTSTGSGAATGEP